MFNSASILGYKEISVIANPATNAYGILLSSPEDDLVLSDQEIPAVLRAIELYYQQGLLNQIAESRTKIIFSVREI